MKNKFLLWAASALFVITGCTTDVIVDEKPVTVNGRKITLTASMPMRHRKPASVWSGSGYKEHYC